MQSPSEDRKTNEYKRNNKLRRPLQGRTLPLLRAYSHVSSFPVVKVNSGPYF